MALDGFSLKHYFYSILILTNLIGSKSETLQKLLQITKISVSKLCRFLSVAVQFSYIH